MNGTRGGGGEEGRKVDFISPKKEGPPELGSACSLLEREQADINSSSFSNTVRTSVPSTPDRSHFPSRPVH